DMRAQSVRVRPVAELRCAQRREHVAGPRVARVEAVQTDAAVERPGPAYRCTVPSGQELDVDPNRWVGGFAAEEREVRHAVLIEVGAGDEPSVIRGRGSTPGAQALAGRSGSDVDAAVPASSERT